MGKALHVGVDRVQSVLQNEGVTALKLVQARCHHLRAVMAVEGFRVPPAQPFPPGQEASSLHADQSNLGLPGACQDRLKIDHIRRAGQDLAVGPAVPTRRRDGDLRQRKTSRRRRRQ